MSELSANFSQMDGLQATIYDVGAVPQETWGPLQGLHRESLRSHLPKTEWHRAGEMIGWGGRNNQDDRYKTTRVDPSVLVREKIWKPGQILRDGRMVVISDGSGQPVSATLTALNASATLATRLKLDPAGRFAQAEALTKMYLPPGLPVPLLGGRGYVHLRETFTHPDAQSIDWKHEVSGFTLLGLWLSIRGRNRLRKLSTYLIPSEPADIELTQTAALLEMHDPTSSAHHLPGYAEGSAQVRVELRLAKAERRIEALPGFLDARKDTNITWTTRQLVQLQERFQRRELAAQRKSRRKPK